MSQLLKVDWSTMLFSDLSLLRDGGPPLYEQVRDHLARAIAAGQLSAGERLPATRTVAEDLGVNRATVVEAYRRLAEDGLVEQRGGSGTYVRSTGRPSASAAPRRASRALQGYERHVRGRELPDAGADPIDLAAIAPSERHLPVDDLAACFAHVLAQRGSEALGYAPTAGDARLREVLAERLTARGLRTDPAGVLVVAGAQQGLDLVFRALLDPGDAVLTESPTYHLALDLLHLHRAEVTGLPLLRAPRHGISRIEPDRLDQALARTHAGIVYLMPTFQNPTGLTLDLASRKHLAASCAAAGALVVEDDYEADMRFDGEEVPHVSSLPEAGDVVYVGTLSKALFPGLRVGWVVARPDVLAPLAQVKRVTDLAGSLLMQAVAAELLASGAYDRHVAARVAQNRALMRGLADALAERLPEGARVTRPQGGHAAWVELPASVAGREVARRAARGGVLVTPGELFSPEGEAAPGLRLSIARLRRQEIEKVADVLGTAVRECMQERSASRGRTEHDAPVRT